MSEQSRGARAVNEQRTDAALARLVKAASEGDAWRTFAEHRILGAAIATERTERANRFGAPRLERLPEAAAADARAAGGGRELVLVEQERRRQQLEGAVIETVCVTHRVEGAPASEPRLVSVETHLLADERELWVGRERGHALDAERAADWLLGRAEDVLRRTRAERAR